jgi:hypothetical protein
MNPLVGEARCREDRGEPFQAPGAHPCLLGEFPRGTGLGRLARLEGAGGDLPDHVIRRVAELPDEKHPRVGALRIVEKGDDRRGTGMADHLEDAGGAVGELDRVMVHVDDAAGVGAAGGEKHGE